MLKRWAGVAVLLGTLGLLFSGCGGGEPKAKKDTDPAYRFEVEQVRYYRKGIFPFDPLIGRAFIRSDHVIPSADQNLLFPSKSKVALRMFEDGMERDVFRIEPFSNEGRRMNVLVMALVTKGLFVGQGGGIDVHPQLKEALRLMVNTWDEAFDERQYNLSIVYCWGKVERRYPFTNQELVTQFISEVDTLTFPGPSEGSFMECLEPNLADYDWLQRATTEAATEAKLKHGTLPLFFDGSQNWRSNVVILTDGEPFREGSLDVFSDLLVKGNFPLYTVGVSSSTQGDKGLNRLRDLYDRRKLGGAFIMVPDHESLPKMMKDLFDSWLAQARSYVVEYVSGYSGTRGTEVPTWGAWKTGQYTSRPVKTNPGTYHRPLRWIVGSLVVALVLGFFIYILYHFKIWPFREKVRVTPCPEGCGHLIPEDWPTCRFCELKGVWGRLVVLNGDRAGEVFYLKNDYYTVGSGEDDDIIVTNLKEFPVTPGHVALHWVQSGEKIVLRPEGDSTSVGRRSVSGSSVNLRFGDVVELGHGGVATVLLRGVGRTY